MAPTKQEILAASAGWVAVTLNVVPGLGAGYLSQRRWKANWITSALATTWFVLGAALGQDAEAGEELQNQWVGLGGLVALAAGTAVEAGLAVKKAHEEVQLVDNHHDPVAKGAMRLQRPCSICRRTEDFENFGRINGYHPVRRI